MYRRCPLEPPSRASTQIIRKFRCRRLPSPPRMNGSWQRQASSGSGGKGKGPKAALRRGQLARERMSALGGKRTLTISTTAPQMERMEVRQPENELPFWLVYLRAALAFFLIFLGADWLAYLLLD